MKLLNIVVVVFFIFFTDSLCFAQIFNRIEVPDSLSYIAVESSFWKDGRYCGFRKQLIVVDSNLVVIPKSGEFLSAPDFEYLLSLFDTKYGWEANLILYDVFNRNSRATFFFEINKEQWELFFKDYDLTYWMSLYKLGWGAYVPD